ncbi:BspA family leucine-rich repeat surface protein [Companilactobacillus nantensis]|uniref:BspA family leucine-rich repeat surface protein n=1 Tax=Companilactobacillus nantensis TaxID=305793 RepID=UPI000710B5A4|nr:BspA family leucine-rich repeat surface protein [Companilactobacillus nantensis]GEO63938.1 hypothetical protein LNA01_11210 [Companilactobacillus nantensis]
MRFNQLKRDPNTVIRKKLYRKGKSWVVASSLALASGLIFLGTSGISVQADVVNSDTEERSVADVDDIQQKETTPTETSQSTGLLDTPADETQDKEGLVSTEEPVSDETSSNDATDEDQQSIENANSDDPPAGTETQQTIIKDYNPDADFVDNTNEYYQSGTDYTIPDEQIPDKIHQEGIFQSGMDGTSPYFVTNEKNLYFLDGTLDATYTRNLIGDSDFMKKNVLNIDTSLADRVYFPKKSDGMFSQLGNEEFWGMIAEYSPKLNLSKVDTSNVTSMNGLFSGDYLSSLDLSSFNTRFVTNMSNMFGGTTVPELDLSSFDTSNVTDMSDMFNSTAIPVLDLGGFNTTNVKNMSNMFSGINYQKAISGQAVTSLDLSSFNTGNVTNMSNMFSSSVFSTLNLKSFDTSQVTDMSYMFSEAAVPILDLSSFDTSNVQTMKCMFDQFNAVQNSSNNEFAYPLATLNVSSFKGGGLNTSDAIDNMFSSARVTNINMPNFKIDSDAITSETSIFNGLTADTVSIPNFDGSKIKNWDKTFTDARINKLDISNWSMLTNSDTEMFFGAVIKQITLGPTNSFIEDIILSFRDNNDGMNIPDKDDQWISIGENGVVDPTTTFYALPISEEAAKYNDDDAVQYGVGHYYNGSGELGVKTFVPDVDIIGKVTLNVSTTVDGKDDEDVTYPDLYGKIGIPITLDVPPKEGYQADKKTITATVTDSGITTEDDINYTKISTGGTGGSSGTSQNIFISDRPQTANYQRIAIYPDQGSVTLYKQEGQKFVPITDRALEADSGWYYDKVAYVGSENSGMKYYRVSTNEWVRANQAYLYQPNKVVIRTKAGDPKQLIHSEGTLATSRMISPNTDWYSDLIGYLGEGQYYRVATNEFVNKADVTVIQDA